MTLTIKLCKLVILSCVCLSACNLSVGLWTRIPIPESNYGSGFDGKNIWLASLLGDSLSYYAPDDKGGGELKTIYLPPDSDTRQICVTESNVWIVTWKYHVISYDLVDETLTEHHDLDGKGYVNCHEQGGQKVSFVVDKKIALFDGKDWFSINAPTDDEVADFTLDPNGDMWAITRGGDIYTKRPVAEMWALWGRTEGRRMTWTSPDVLWLNNQTSVFRWAVKENQQPEAVLSVDKLIFNIVEVADNVVWIIGSEGIWAYGNNSLDRIKFSSDRILLFDTQTYYRNVVVDRQSNTIYIMTSRYILFNKLSIVLR